MHRFEAFPDLRRGLGERNAEIRLWPTFTDIMTVILMIFMLTMVVVIIKNAYLADQLLFSRRQQEQTRSKLEQANRTVESLKVNIAGLEEKLRAREMKIILLQEEARLLQSRLESKRAAAAALQAELGRLNQKIRILEQAVDAKTAELLQARQAAKAEMQRLKEASQEKIAALSEAARRQQEEFNRKMAALLSRLREKEAVIVALDNEKKELELSLARQRSAYSALEEKYIRLLRPARSPAGKKVVTVHYSRRGGKYRIRFKDIDSDHFETLDRGRLHRRLEDLKKRLGDRLYVKIVIPEDSGLSYNEAWRFTRDILSRYDYYYQTRPAPAAEKPPAP